MTHDHTAEAPVCYRHPDRHTLLSCTRCGRPICAACSIDASVGQRCPECVRQEGTQKVIPPRTRRGAPVRTGIPATRTFIGLAVAFFLLTGLGSAGLELALALRQSNLAIGAGEWWRLFTPVLLHGGWMHILFNMWALWVLGPQVERAVGRWPFVAMYLASAGVGSAFVFFLTDPATTAVGASGAIFGLFGIWANWAVRRRNTIQGRAMLQQIGFLLLINAILPITIPIIAWQAHLGGLIAGYLIGEMWSRLPGRDQAGARTVVALGVAVIAVIAVLI